MSEINMYCDEIIWGEIFPDIILIQCGIHRTDINEKYIASNSVKSKTGRFGLTIRNDPFVVFTYAPQRDEYVDEEDEENINMTKEEWKTYNEIVMRTGSRYDHELRGYVTNMYRLYDACMKSGYSKEKHGGNLGLWISDRIARFIENREPETVYEWVNKKPNATDFLNSEQACAEIKEFLENQKPTEEEIIKCGYDKWFEKLRKIGKENDAKGIKFEIASLYKDIKNEDLPLKD